MNEAIRIMHDTRRPPRHAFLAVVALGVSWCSPVLAASPHVSGVSPHGGQRGTSVVVTFHGNHLGEPIEVLTYDPRITVASIEKIDAAKFKATLALAPDCRIGEHHLRARTNAGWADARTFYVGAFPSVAEKEPNNDFANPQKVTMNVTVEGSIGNEDVDYFAVDAKKGDRITAEIEAMRLGVTLIDPYVAIMDARRFELAACDDSKLLRQDSTVSILAPEDGTYIVMVRESAYGGADNSRYRLHIGNQPRPTAVYPAGGPPGKPLAAKFLGDKAGPFEATLDLPADAPMNFPVIVEHRGLAAPSPNFIRVVDMPNVLEAEPNNDAAHATPTGGDAPTPPVAFNGILDKPGDHDWFRFKATKDATYEFRVYAREPMRSPVDSMLDITDGAGNGLAFNDDLGGGQTDSSLSFKIPADGEYRVRVRDHLGQGGPDWVYRVEIAPPRPALALRSPEVARDETQARQFANVPRGGRWMSIVQVERTHIGGDNAITCDDLPAGVRMFAPQIRRGQNQVPVVFEAAPDAAVAGALTHLTVGNVDKKSDTRGGFHQNIVLVRGLPNNTPYYATRVEGFPVAVTVESPYSIEVIEPKVPLLQSGQMALRVVAKRASGFDEPISLDMPYRSPGVGVGGTVTIEKGKTETVIQLSANGDAATGEWPLVVLASSGVRGGATFTSSQLATLKVAPPLLRGELQMTTTEQGKPAQVVCKLTPATPFEGEGTLTLEGLPGKCQSQPIKVNKDAREAVFQVAVDPTAPTGQHKSLFVAVTLARDGETMTQTFAGGGTLRIDKPRVPEPAAAPPPAPVAATPAAAPAPAAPPEPKRLSRLEQLREENTKKK